MDLPRFVELIGEPDSVEIALAGFFMKQYRLAKAGYCAPQHSHEYDHVTALALGVIDVWCDSRYIGRRTAPALIEIKAGTKHLFQAVTDNCLFYCVHKLDDDEDQPRIVEKHEIVLS